MTREPETRAKIPLVEADSAAFMHPASLRPARPSYRPSSGGLQRPGITPSARRCIVVLLGAAGAVAAGSAAILGTMAATAFAAEPAVGAAAASCPSLLARSFGNLQSGASESLCRFAGKVVVFVNTASQCGYTPQYEGLEKLYARYRDRGLIVAGFPSNDFGGQEPGSNREIAEFCRTEFGIEFPMFEKSSVSGPGANPLFADLARRTGQAPKWNFHKYVVDRSGSRVTSFDSEVPPDNRVLVQTIERLLAAPPPR